jgi:hypothetical protein
VAADRTGCVALYTPVAEGTHPAAGIKDRFEPVCGSVHQAYARLNLYAHPLGGDFSDFQGPVVEGVTSKSTYQWAPNFDPSVAKGG